MFYMMQLIFLKLKYFLNYPQSWWRHFYYRSLISEDDYQIAHKAVEELGLRIGECVLAIWKIRQRGYDERFENARQVYDVAVDYYIEKHTLDESGEKL